MVVFPLKSSDGATVFSPRAGFFLPVRSSQEHRATTRTIPATLASGLNVGRGTQLRRRSRLARDQRSTQRGSSFWMTVRAWWSTALIRSLVRWPWSVGWDVSAAPAANSSDQIIGSEHHRLPESSTDHQAEEAGAEVGRATLHEDVSSNGKIIDLLCNPVARIPRVAWSGPSAQPKAGSPFQGCPVCERTMQIGWIGQPSASRFSASSQVKYFTDQSLRKCVPERHTSGAD